MIHAHRSMTTARISPRRFLFTLPFMLLNTLFMLYHVLMIINTGNRTDIPAFYSRWFMNRIRAGYIMVRNPYAPQNITKYPLVPDVIDILCFGTKNPEPMLKHLSELTAYHQFWSVTITPYDKDIEPHVPDKTNVMDSFCKLSSVVDIKSVSWRYDPVFLNEKYDIDFHIRSFSNMCAKLESSIDNCVVSFIDLYEKTKRNFRGIREVSHNEQEFLIEKFVEIAAKHGIKIITCCEDPKLGALGADVSGCMNKSILERACGFSLDIPQSSLSRLMTREGCNCLIGNDIGAYNTCGHGCLYCYANYDSKTVAANIKKHNPESPLLIGRPGPEDIIRDARIEVYRDLQIKWL